MNTRSKWVIAFFLLFAAFSVSLWWINGQTVDGLQVLLMAALGLGMMISGIGAAVSILEGVRRRG
jgi:hypothetical protein